MGVETVDPPYFLAAQDSRCPPSRRCRYSDAAFVNYDFDVRNSRGRIARVPLGSTGAISPTAPPFRISAEGPPPMMGDRINKIGIVTGHTQGIVDQTCMRMRVADTLVDLLCQYGVRESEVDEGDSGAPAFQITNDPEPGDVALHGIVWGRFSPTYFAFSHMRADMGIQKDLGRLSTCGAAFDC